MQSLQEVADDHVQYEVQHLDGSITWVDLTTCCRDISHVTSCNAFLDAASAFGTTRGEIMAMVNTKRPVTWR
ncbi:hypothetical protein A2Y99_00740 [Candidatus Gottesmanbacteria bacterium RBG_13_37_7]|uniref:Uncharacterized protein n=1 Tax=Candidatus Gottesmanbacteria bacterium RBG_13_37_7 TaxID=1798369 RepID=A0A1F5YG40_9BACT|nr:MAG: hypothetical protein A2Y99_00740 [Candidatus Gottesmanbacteria bacterium RBG_13_37_7]